MRVQISAIGRLKPGPARDLWALYAGRLVPPASLVELEEKRALPAPQLKEREAALLLGSCPRGATLVALDERGQSLTSPGFAARLTRWRDQGVEDLVFLIGGADGHDETVRRRADLLLSLGAMTWPHLLVRGLLAEQLYRAQQIAAGHPYHRE
ncbi:MAG TPA: 23S rRNA (pseudouridine(1915)-N(3))-methyltransferase RlmH [Stellaceae bacterium]|nr:23S rRNA (pseudouridine(1915)-N(3))-methyltransferase RlmH [Stellaceae bacterium]